MQNSSACYHVRRTLLLSKLWLAARTVQSQTHPSGQRRSGTACMFRVSSIHASVCRSSIDQQMRRASGSGCIVILESLWLDFRLKRSTLLTVPAHSSMDRCPGRTSEVGCVRLNRLVGLTHPDVRSAWISRASSGARANPFPAAA